VLMCTISLLALGNWAFAADESETQPNYTKIAVNDSAPYHVHAPGKQFSVEVIPDADVKCQWKDFRGKALTEPVLLKASERRTIQSPEKPEVGYYGLVFEAVKPDVDLERKEFGFAVMPLLSVSDRHLEPDSPFAMIHADIKDPYLTGWIKTLGARFDPDRWRALIKERRQVGLLELPLVTGKPWETDSTKPVSTEELDALYKKMKEVFQAEHSVLFWELGIEENLRWRRNRDKWTHYWSNLAKKFQIVRRAANEV
ncbi:unnamed protein product, partial [marine sediment metagenome]